MLFDSTALFLLWPGGSGLFFWLWHSHQTGKQSALRVPGLQLIDRATGFLIVQVAGREAGAGRPGVGTILHRLPTSRRAALIFLVLTMSGSRPHRLFRLSYSAQSWKHSGCAPSYAGYLIGQVFAAGLSCSLVCGIHEGRKVIRWDG